ncbi:MAG: LysE family translocator [Bosea sp. (in: a-proteobacteria)]
MTLTGFTDPSHLWLFALLVFGIIVVPGMDMAFVMARSLTNGRRGGFLAVLGLVIGGMAHTAFAWLGVGLVLKTAPGVFPVMLLAGSAYLAWIGWSLVRHAGAIGLVVKGDALSSGRIIGQAILTCLMNPKAYLFMIAVFPQFLRPSQGALLHQSITLGLMIAVAQATIYGAVAVLAASLSQNIAASPSSQLWLGRATGLLLLLTAVWALWQGWGSV